MITVLTIAYNQRLYTEMLLNSLSRPECANVPFELVCIDNGSTDKTEQLVVTYPLTKNPNFKNLTYFAFSENLGVAAAINKGFQLAQTDYIVQADNDVVFGPQSLSIMRAWMERYPLGMISPNWPWIQKKLGIRYFENPGDITPPKLKKLKKTGLKAKLEPFRATGSCWMCSQELFAKIGGWDTEYKNICASDDFLWKVSLSGAKRFIVPCPVYHPGKITRGKIPENSEQQEKDLRRFAEKWGGHPEDKSRLRELQRKAGVAPDPELPKTIWQRLFHW
ncbi:glycosyltransferase family 2 protein [bacterium]|nr:glycosyltransferase family 2 protein [bacterium]